MTPADKSSSPIRDQAIAVAAAQRAKARLARLRENGETIADEADFINREIEQAFLDIKAGQSAGAARQ